MTGMFFALAFIAAANPKLLALDLLLIRNRRPRAMFTCILAGGIGTAVAIGLIDVLVSHGGTVKTQRKVSAGVDLGLGLLLLIIGGLVMTGLLARAWARRPQAGKRAGQKKSPGDSWAERALREPRLGIATVIGVVIGLPGAAYLTALHHLRTGKYSTSTEVIAVLVFVVIEFLLIIVPWLCLELWPAGTARVLRGAQAWFVANAAALIAWVCLLLGVYLTVTGLIRLL